LASAAAPPGAWTTGVMAVDALRFLLIGELDFVAPRRVGKFGGEGSAACLSLGDGDGVELSPGEAWRSTQYR
jgi:hypothetical protein